jgi:hypothetical protein
MSRRRSHEMPTKYKVLRAWKSWLKENKPIVIPPEYDGYFCFACGKRGEVERAHIKARSEGGSDREENIHLLCPACHGESEYMKDKLYWHWIIWKPLWDDTVGAMISKFLIDQAMHDDQYKQAIKNRDQEYVDRFILNYLSI